MARSDNSVGQVCSAAFYSLHSARRNRGHLFQFAGANNDNKPIVQPTAAAAGVACFPCSVVSLKRYQDRLVDGRRAAILTAVDRQRISASWQDRLHSRQMQQPWKQRRRHCHGNVTRLQVAISTAFQSVRVHRHISTCIRLSVESFSDSFCQPRPNRSFVLLHNASSSSSSFSTRCHRASLLRYSTPGSKTRLFHSPFSPQTPGTQLTVIGLEKRQHSLLTIEAHIIIIS